MSRARNEAAAARHEILAFCDDDMWAPPTWFGTLVRALAEAGARTAVTGRVVAGAPEAKGGFASAVVTGDARIVYDGRLDTDVLTLQHGDVQIRA